jgi:hypothetical protein
MVALQNSLHNGETDARAGQVRQVVQALEDAEKSLVIGHVESDPIVVQEKDHPCVGIISAKGNFRGFLPSGEFPCILKEVLECKLQQQGITEGGEAGHDGDLDVSFGVETPQAGDNVLCHVGEIDNGLMHDVARDASQLQQVVEEASHFVAGFDDVSKVSG